MMLVVADEMEDSMESMLVRKGLNTRIREALDASPTVVRWAAETRDDGRLFYRIVQDYGDVNPGVGEVEFTLSPGGVADWFGLVRGRV